MKPHFELVGSIESNIISFKACDFESDVNNLDMNATVKHLDYIFIHVFFI